MRNTIIDIFMQVFPTIVICLVIYSTLRIAYLIKNKIKFHFINETFLLVFITYVLCLFYVVTYQDVSGIGTINITPFQEIFRYEFGSSLFVKNIIGNVLMFIPYGFFVSYFLKEKRTLMILMLTLVVSATIEYTQLKIGRVFDIDDILLNLIGGMLGSFIYIGFAKIGELFKK